MSLHVSIVDCPDISNAEDYPEDFEQKMLGTEEEVMRRIREAFPVQGNGYSIQTEGFYVQFELDKSEEEDGQIDNILCTIGGSSRGGEACAVAVAHLFGVRAICASSGDVLAEDDPEVGLQVWEKLKDGDFQE